MKLKIRKILGAISEFLFPHYGTCYRCGISWRFHTWHVTSFTFTSGCFPLCESCWRDLTPKERFPFYMDLILNWEFDSISERAEVEKQIQKAVLDGK